MRYAYALMLTMLLAFMVVPDALAQRSGRGRGRTSGEETTTSRRTNDETVSRRDNDDRVVSSSRSGRGRGRTAPENGRDDDRVIYRDRDNDVYSRRDRDYDDDDWDDDDWDDDDYYGKARKGNGPPFCRDGRGHPTKGWEWCEDKGYGRNRRYDPVWDRDRSLGDIIFGDRSGRGRGRTTDRRYVERGILDDLLGRRVYNYVDDYRRGLGLRDALSGYWLDGNGRQLEVRSGNTPVARFYDTNGDGRVDDVRLNSRRY